MVNTINPADCNPGEVYEGTVHGVERTVLIRRDASDSYPWESLGEVLDHEDVSDLVRLVPAREVTRQDLPSRAKAISLWLSEGSRGLSADAVLDAVVAHLNANGGLPTDDRWRCAHEIVEQERDQARESLREACKVAQSYKVDAYQATERAEAAERERDEAQGDLSRVAREMARRIIAVREDYLEASSQHDWLTFERDDARRERDEWKARAEAAEARTAPAITREDVEAALAQEHRMAFGMPVVSIDVALETVCSLFGVEAEPADPVEQKAVELFEATDDSIWAWATAPVQTQDRYRAIAAHVLGQEAGHE